MYGRGPHPPCPPPRVQNPGPRVQTRVQTAVDRPKSLGITGPRYCCECRYASKLAHIGGDVTQYRGDT